MQASGPPEWRIDLVEELIEVGREASGDVVRLLRPVDPSALLDEDAFAADEFLPYWAELWPSARSLAEVLPASLTGRRVLELGCGLGLPSLVAARRGAVVLATDWAGEALELLALNAGRNGVAVEVSLLDWTDVPATLAMLAERGFDLVLAADVAYETRNVAPLAALFSQLGCEILLADPGRAAGAALLGRVARRFAASDLGGGVTRLVPRDGPAPDRPEPPG